MAIVVEITNVKQVRRGNEADDATVFVHAIAYESTDPNKTPVDQIDTQFDLNAFLSQHKTNQARLDAIEDRMRAWGQQVKASAGKSGALAKALIGHTVTIE